MHHIDCRPVEWHATTDEGEQHDAESPHIDGRTSVVQIRDRNVSLCSWLGSVHASQQLWGRVVLLTAACRERCCSGESRRISGGNSDRCECKIRDDGTASCFAGCCSGIEMDKDIFEFEICGGRVYGLCACHHEGGGMIPYYGAPPRARG